MRVLEIEVLWPQAVLHQSRAAVDGSEARLGPLGRFRHRMTRATPWTTWPPQAPTWPARATSLAPLPAQRAQEYRRHSSSRSARRGDARPPGNVLWYARTGRRRGDITVVERSPGCDAPRKSGHAHRDNWHISH